MAGKYNSSIPPDLDLDEKYTLRFAALDPSTGAPVPGVVISNVQITADNLSALGDDELATGPFMLVPGPGAG